MLCCTIIPVVPPLDRHVGPCCNVTAVCWCVVPARVCLCFPPHLGATKPPTHREVSPQPRSPFLFVDPQKKIKTTQMQRAYTRERPRLHVDRHLREHRCTGQSRAGVGPLAALRRCQSGREVPRFLWYAEGANTGARPQCCGPGRFSERGVWVNSFEVGVAQTCVL